MRTQNAVKIDREKFIARGEGSEEYEFLGGMAGDGA